MLLDLLVMGDPIAKGRPRHNTKNMTTFTPKRTKNAEAVIAEAAKRQLGDGAVPHEGPCGIAVEFYCATRRRTDGDNLLKLVTDALNHVAYADDVQLVEYFCRVYRGVGKDAARTQILVYELGD